MGKNDDENLFEELDSFFEPINDVGWPEESGFEEPVAPAAPKPEEPDEVASAPLDEESVLGAPEAQGETFEAASYEVVTDQGLAEAEAEVDDEDFAVAEVVEDDIPTITEDGELTFGGESAPELVVGVSADRNELLAPGGPGSAEVADAPVEQVVGGEPTVIQFDEAGLVEPEQGLGFLTDEGITEADDDVIGTLPLEGERDFEREILADLAPDDMEEPASTLADGLSGPSWQEPTHVEVGAEPAGPSQPRNMPAAFVTGLALGAVAFITLIWSPPLFAWLAGAGVLFALFEFYVALQKRHMQPATLVGLLFGGFMLFGAYHYGVGAAAMFLGLGLIFAILWEIATPAKFRKQITSNVGLTVLGMAYIPFLASFGMEILAKQDDPSGAVLLIFILGLTFAYDTAAFLAGSMWGEHQIAPQISPKKSIEGAALGSLAVALLAAILGGAVGLDLPSSVLLAVVVIVGAPIGDLAESLFKRDLGIKDMGNVLPGHGGVLDRIDSLLVVLPLAYLVVIGL